MKNNQIPEGPRVCYEEYTVRRPFIHCHVMVEGADVLGLYAYGDGFAFCQNDPWDETWGRKLSRRKAVADAERNYYRAVADIKYADRMREARRLVSEKYPEENIPVVTIDFTPTFAAMFSALPSLKRVLLDAAKQVNDGFDSAKNAQQ